MKPVIFGLSAAVLSPFEISFFRQANPLGLVLFKRNIETPEQVKALVDSACALLGRKVPFFIDQEGGRVARLGPPFWPALCPMATIGRIAGNQLDQGRIAARLHARVTASFLSDLGIVGNFSPVLDLCFEGATSAIGDRALSSDPALVSDLGRIVVETYLHNGILPCIKHLPGHGRMALDPHHELPCVTTDLAALEVNDFVPFRALAGCPLGMTSHALFTAIDPALPASLSPAVHAVIRDKIGFSGLIVTDDLDMKALSPSCADNALAALRAGSDIALQCSGNAQIMESVAEALPSISDRVMKKWTTALTLVKPADPAYDPAPDLDQLKRLENLAA